MHGLFVLRLTWVWLGGGIPAPCRGTVTVYVRVTALASVPYTSPGIVR